MASSENIQKASQLGTCFIVLALLGFIFLIGARLFDPPPEPSQLHKIVGVLKSAVHFNRPRRGDWWASLSLRTDSGNFGGRIVRLGFLLGSDEKSELLQLSEGTQVEIWVASKDANETVSSEVWQVAVGDHFLISIKQTVSAYYDQIIVISKMLFWLLAIGSVFRLWAWHAGRRAMGASHTL